MKPLPVPSPGTAGGAITKAFASGKAIELKPEYVEAYNGLATIYNAQKKFDLAQQSSQKAAEQGTIQHTAVWI